MLPNTYGWEKLASAVSFLAASSAPAKKRLHEAYFYHLHSIQEENLPTEALWRKLSDVKIDAFGEDFSERIERLSDDEVTEIIRRIVSIYDHVCRFMPRDQS